MNRLNVCVFQSSPGTDECIGPTGGLTRRQQLSYTCQDVFNSSLPVCAVRLVSYTCQAVFNSSLPVGAVMLVSYTHRLISRDRLTKTAQLCCWSTILSFLFCIAASLPAQVWKWGGFVDCSEFVIAGHWNAKSAKRACKIHWSHLHLYSPTLPVNYGICKPLFVQYWDNFSVTWVLQVHADFLYTRIFSTGVSYGVRSYWEICLVGKGRFSEGGEKG